jgi:hypothetical protein
MDGATDDPTCSSQDDELPLLEDLGFIRRECCHLLREGRRPAA